MKKTTKILSVCNAVLTSVLFIGALERTSGGSAISKTLAVLIGACAIGNWICLIINFFVKTNK